MSSLIIFKLILPPLLILAASLAGRRWGDAVGGWFVGLPLTSGPVAVFLSIQHGADFAAIASNGSLIGTAAQGFFSLAYALTVQYGWWPAIIAAALAYAASAFVANLLPLNHLGYFIFALATLTLVAKLIPHANVTRARISPPRWDLPARMIAAAILVVSLTAIATFTGAQVAGAIASFPVFGAILTIFAHRQQGNEMARQVLRGMVLALYGFAIFFFVLGLTLVKFGIPLAFLMAIACTLLAQGVALRMIRGSATPQNA